MHRSRLSILLLDLPPDAHEAGRDFWSRATGHPVEPDATDEKWASLGSFADGFHLEVQRTGEGTPPRWHVDIETDDIEAEVARLEALGARRHRDMGRFWQLTDPAGLVFCVVGIQTGEEFDRHATTWP
jgi:predicted enzyme related to lactoylglutathione lyase